jgi:hypothetical protein
MPLCLDSPGWAACELRPEAASPSAPPVRSGRGMRATQAIGLDALLELLVDLNHRIADVVDLVALPRNGKKYLPAPAPSSPSSDVQARMTTVIEHRPATTAALLRQGIRHHRPDRVLPVPVRRHGRRWLRWFVSQPAMAEQALAEAGRPDASFSKGFEPKTLIEKRKRAAGIEPASSAWKAEVLPLNYARNRIQSSHNGAPGAEESASAADLPIPEPAVC